ncbi:MAG TPA: GH1 family beta-glucosidase [Actinomycetota bacterium]|nr:GH1 family beta-glucosidase [Actinomycetota bacterium]
MSPTSGSDAFPEGFLWGVSTSAYQIEGAVHADGRGRSIWDTFSHAPGRVKGADTGDVACDHYHRFVDDVALMADLRVRAYRFSVAWPRIQPDGRGAPNPRGLDFYRRLIDALLGRGIVPVPTLYHWDLPQALEDGGGWPVRDTAARFAEYASTVHEAFVGAVPYWITLNEPWCSAWLGYGSGVHAPGRRDDALALAASHHLLLADGWAREAMTGGGSVGIALNPQPARPATDAPEDVRAARLADLNMNGLYLDPLFGRGYPPELVEHYASATDFGFVQDGDLETIARPLDFLGVNYYRIHTITATRPSEGMEEIPGSLGAWSIVPSGVPVTAMEWPIEPLGLTDLLVGIQREYAPPRVMVTENGAAFDDEVGPGGAIHDAERTAYLREHIAAARAALAAGVPLEGFFIWSLLDNFEWAEGYSRRFGIVHVDFQTQHRTPKDSAVWFRRVAGPPVESLVTGSAEPEEGS